MNLDRTAFENIGYRCTTSHCNVSFIWTQIDEINSSFMDLEMLARKWFK